MPDSKQSETAARLLSATKPPHGFKKPYRWWAMGYRDTVRGHDGGYMPPSSDPNGRAYKAGMKAARDDLAQVTRGLQ